MSPRSLVEAFRTPVHADTRRALETAWARVPSALRAPRQFLGRQYAGCGATIGAMPRCDFACRGCYLGARANRVPAASLSEVKRQLGRLREWLGEGGNVQLTDGEVTLRPEGELIEMIRHARALGLVPMLMTHGDTFRRRPGLLERLVVVGGLSEVSLHVDTTQRGRHGFPVARREEELRPLRDELAEMVRRARRRTGRRLGVATTVTVTAENVTGVPEIVRWTLANADAIKLVSFLPVAAVGRTEVGLGGVTPDALWRGIAEGLYGDPAEATRLAAHEGWLGHPACSRFVQGVVIRPPGEAPAFHPIFRPDDPGDRRFVDAWLARFGGLTFRLDRPGRGLARVAGVLAGAPGLVLRGLVPALSRWPARLAPEHPWRLVAGWLAGRTRVDYLNIVSHHFMSATELATAGGRERIALCAFKVAAGDGLVSMCEMNARGGREAYYAGLSKVARSRGRAPGAARPRNEEEP